MVVYSFVLLFKNFSLHNIFSAQEHAILVKSLLPFHTATLPFVSISHTHSLFIFDFVLLHVNHHLKPLLHTDLLVGFFFKFFEEIQVEHVEMGIFHLQR